MSITKQLRTKGLSQPPPAQQTVKCIKEDPDVKLCEKASDQSSQYSDADSDRTSSNTRSLSDEPPSSDLGLDDCSEAHEPYLHLTQTDLPLELRHTGVSVDLKTGIPTFEFIQKRTSCPLTNDQGVARARSCTHEVRDAVQKALDAVRGEEPSSDEKDYEMIDSAYRTIWAQLCADSSYLMSRTEYAVFNYFQARHRGHPRAVAAQKLYWQNN